MDPSAPQQSPPSGAPHELSASAKAAFARFVARWRARRQQAAQDALEEVQRRAQMPPQVRQLNRRLDMMRYIRHLRDEHGFEVSEELFDNDNLDEIGELLLEFATDLAHRAIQSAEARGSTTLTAADLE